MWPRLNLQLMLYQVHRADTTLCTSCSQAPAKPFWQVLMLTGAMYLASDTLDRIPRLGL
jgi:hypothetical protein